MKIAAICILIPAALALVPPALAQSSISERNGVITTKHTELRGKQIERVTCREFLALRDEFKPQLISYAVGYDKAKKPEDAVVDIAGIRRLVPVVETTCKTVPQQSLLQRIRADLRRL